MLNKEHNSLEGIQKIVGFKASLNWGLSEKLKKAFPDIVSTKRPHNISEAMYKKFSPQRVAGFCIGESNFFITVQKSKTKSGLAVWLRFSIPGGDPLGSLPGSRKGSVNTQEIFYY